MKTEQEWMAELEIEVTDRTTKKDLCRLLDVEWSENLGEFSIDQLREQIKLRTEIARKYGQKLKGEHFNKTPEEHERYLANVAVRTMTIPGKYSLRQASKLVGVPTDYLNQLRLKKIISYERIGWAGFVSIENLKEELRSPTARAFFAERRFEYAS